MGVSNYKGVIKFSNDNAYELIVDQTPTATLLATAPETAEEGIRLIKSACYSACYTNCNKADLVGCCVYYDYRTGFTYEPGSVCIMGYDS